MLEYSGSAAASAVIMSHQLRNNKIVFVEGVQDGLLLEHLFDNEFSAIPADGCCGVIEAVDTIEKYNAQHSKNLTILGFIDLDYLHLKDENNVLQRKNIITTTFRDIEIDLIHTSALKRVLQEKANPGKWKDESSVVQEILENLKELSLLRAYNHIFSKKWDFKWIDIYKYSNKNGEIDYTKLISTFKQQNHINNAEWEKFQLWSVQSDIPLNMIARGHDVTCLLGKMLMKKFGNRKKEEISLGIIEENLRLAAEHKFLSIFQWFKKLFEWAYNNRIKGTPNSAAVFPTHCPA